MINVEIVMPFEKNIFLLSCEEELLTDGLMERIRKELFVEDDSKSDLSKEGRGRYSWLCHIEGCHMLGHNVTVLESGLREGSSLVLI